MLRIPITYELKCETPVNREKCKLNEPHCYITRNGKIVALVWIDPVCIEKEADLLSHEKEAFLSVIREYQYVIEEEYRRVANGW